MMNTALILWKQPTQMLANFATLYHSTAEFLTPTFRSLALRRTTCLSQMLLLLLLLPSLASQNMLAMNQFFHKPRKRIAEKLQKKAEADRGRGRRNHRQNGDGYLGCK